MFKLFARVTNGLECIQKAMSGFLRDTGKSMVTEDASGEGSGRNAVTYVQSLLDLRDQYNMFLELSFGSHQLFKNAISSVCTCVCVYMYVFICVVALGWKLMYAFTCIYNVCTCRYCVFILV